MKLLILILSFTIQNKAVVWEKEYKTSLTFEQLTSQLRQSGSFTDIQTSGTTLTARIENLEADYKGAGYKEMTTPMFIARSFINAFVVIEYGAGSYTVSVKKIMLEQMYSDGLTRQGEKTSIETYALNRDKTDFKPAFKKSPATILDYTFQNLFEPPQRD